MGDDEFLWRGWSLMEFDGINGINGNDLVLGPNKSENVKAMCPQKMYNAI